MALDLGNQRHCELVRCSSGHLWLERGRSARVAIRLTHWDAGLRLERSTPDSPRWMAGGLRSCGFRLFDRASIADGDPIGGFLADIPAEVRAIAAPIAWRQLEVLQLCRRDPRAIELGASNRCLLWLVAQWLRRNPETDPGEMLGRKRRAIVGAMFGEEAGTDARVRVLAKIESPVLDERLVAPLSTMLALTQLPDVFLHLRSIPHTVVIAWQSRLAYLNLPVVRRAVLGGACALDLVELARTIEDTLRMAAFVEPRIEARLHGCSSLARLIALHDELVRAWRAGSAAWRNRRVTIAFPEPPLEGSDTITPITTVEELETEGREMHHCCASYAGEIAAGRCYLYRVLAPERGTLEVARVGARFELAQFKLAANKTPSEYSFAVIRRWLANAVAKRARSVS